MLEAPAAMLFVAGVPWLPSVGACPFSAMSLTAWSREKGQICIRHNSRRAAASTTNLRQKFKAKCRPCTSSADPHMRLGCNVMKFHFGISPPFSTGQVLACGTPCAAVLAGASAGTATSGVMSQSRVPALLQLQVLPATVCCRHNVTRDASTRQGATHLLSCPALQLLGSLLLLCTLQAGSLRSTTVLLQLGSRRSRTLLLLCSR